MAAGMPGMQAPGFERKLGSVPLVISLSNSWVRKETRPQNQKAQARGEKINQVMPAPEKDGLLNENWSYVDEWRRLEANISDW